MTVLVTVQRLGADSVSVVVPESRFKGGEWRVD